MQNVWAIIISGVLSCILTGTVFMLAKKGGILVPVRRRDTHKQPIPRIGGVAIFLAFFVTVLFFRFTDPASVAGFGFPFSIFGFSIDKRLLALLIGALVLVAAMFFDDLRGLKAYQKLAVQILVGFVVVAGGIGITYLNNPFGGLPFQLDAWQIPIQVAGVVYHFVVVADLLVVVWLVMLMNVLNFSDGIDGLAGTISIIALAVLVLLSSRVPVLQPATALVASIGIGAVLGFLVWNVPPARIFMGDGGSMFLGFLIGVLAIIAGAKFATTLVVLAIPILDAFWVIGSRLARGLNPFTTPDQRHLHHRFLQAGFSVRQTLIVLGGISGLFGVAALQQTGIAKIRAFVVAIMMIGLVMGAIHVIIRSRDKDMA